MSRSSGAHAIRPAAAAPVFAALGDPTRLRLVASLGAAGPMSLTRLSSGAGVTRQAVRKHLQVLEDAGLAESRWRGRERIWELKPRQLQAATTYLEAVSAHWDRTLGRLKAFVESQEN